MRRSSEIPRQGWVRAGLAFLALVSGEIGIWAAFAPMSFYGAFPGLGHAWVAILPPFNEHLTRDVGEFNLSFAVLFAWAAVVPERRLVQATVVAYLVYAVPHFVYHAGHLEHFALGDAVVQTAGLALLVLLCVALLLARLDRAGKQA